MKCTSAVIYLLLFGLACMISRPVVADGTVTIQVKNGNLQVTGQNNRTQCLLIVPTGVSGQYRFSNPPMDNAAPTLFNGETSLTVSGVTGDMKFDLKSGIKMLILSNSELGGSSASPGFAVPRSLKISTGGSSPATIILNKVSTNGSTEIATRNGSDAILLMDCNLVGNVKLNSGGGNDVLLVDGYESSFAFMQNCDINLGSGNDFLMMQYGIVPFQAKFNLGSGNDQIGFFASDLGTTSINGGGGFDHFGAAGSNFVTFSARGLEDQTSLHPFTIYGNAVNTNATFDAADNIYFNLIGF
jgi:hypothetical protein